MTSKTTEPNTHISTSQRINKSELPLSEVDPHSAKQKAAQDKLQLFGTIQTMQRDGRMPHNDQLNELLEKLKTNKVISSRENTMSPDGRKLLHDFRELIQTVQRALTVKNKEELFQSLVYHLHCMESPVKKEHITSTVKSHHDKSEVQSEGKKASDAMFKIGKLILLNNEFRSVLGELIDTSQDIFNSVTGKVGDSLQQAGSGLQDNNNTDKSGKHLVDKALDSALNSQEQSAQSRQHEGTSYHDREPHLINASRDDPRHQGLLNTGDSVHPKAIPGDSNDINNNTAFGGGMSYSHQEPTSSLEHGSIPHQQHTGFTSKGTQEQGIGSSHGIREQTPQNIKEKALNHPMYQNVSEEASEHKQHVQETVKERIPKEKRDELIRRLQSATAEVQKHPDYQDAINTLVQLIKVWSSRLTKVSEGIRSQAKENDRPEQMSYREEAERELKAIIECWAQGQSIDPLLHGVQNVMRDMQNDQQLREYYNAVIKYVDRLAREPGYASQDQSTEEGQRLMDQGHQIVKGQYSDHLNYLSSESRKLMNLMAEDEISKELHAKIATIHRDLWMDSEGNPAFKPHLLNDMRMTLIPAFIDEIKYIPIPRIEYSDHQFDIVVENLILSGDTLLPNIFETKMESFDSFSLKSATESKPGHQSLFIRMSEIQADIDDVVFFYKKKTGFPKISDRGVASLFVGGKGITVSVRVTSVTDNPAKTFKVAYCKCNVDNLKVKVNDSNHDILYKAIRPLVIGQIRKQVAKGIEAKVIDLLTQADQKLTQSIINMNQNLQTKAYEALPEEDKATTRPPSLSQARPRPGLFSTLVAIINRNIQTKVQKRNENRRMSRTSDSRSSQHLDNEKRQVSGSSQHNLPHTGDSQHPSQHGLGAQDSGIRDSTQHGLGTQGYGALGGALYSAQQGSGTQKQHHGADRDIQQGVGTQEQPYHTAGGNIHPTQQGFGAQEQHRGTDRSAEQGFGTQEQYYDTDRSAQQGFGAQEQHRGTDRSAQQGFGTQEQYYDTDRGAQQGFGTQEQYYDTDRGAQQGFGAQEQHRGTDRSAQQGFGAQEQHRGTDRSAQQGFGAQEQHRGTDRSAQQGFGTQEHHQRTTGGIQQGVGAQEQPHRATGGGILPTQQGFGTQGQYYGETGVGMPPTQQELGTQGQGYGETGVGKPLPRKPQALNLENQRFDDQGRYQDATRGIQQPLHQQHQAYSPVNQDLGAQDQYHGTSSAQNPFSQQEAGAQNPFSQQEQRTNQGFDTQHGMSGGVQHSLHEPQQTYNPVNPSAYNAPYRRPSSSNPTSMATDRHHSIVSPPLSPTKKEFDDVPAQKQATDNIADLTNISQH